ncbi:MAG TPA: class I SAM-dependent methyltransferase [Chloroflexota bacterium]
MRAILTCRRPDSARPGDPVRAVDAAGGSGYASAWLAAHGYQVTAVDLDPSQWRVPQVPCVAGDLNEAIPLPTASVDLALSIETIEHLEAPFRFVRELARVTRPGGLVIITTPNVHAIRSRLKYLATGLPTLFEYVADDNMGQHIMPISFPMLLYAFDRCGLEVVDLVTTGPRGSVVTAAVLRAFHLATLPATWLARRSRATYPEHYLRRLTWRQLVTLGDAVSLIVVARRR